MIRTATVASLVLFAAALSSCSLLISHKRSLMHQIRRYEALISDNNYGAANSYYHKKFRWIKEGDETKRDCTAFHDSIKKIESRQEFVIAVDEIVEVDKKRFIVIGTMQVKQADSIALRSVRWKCSMRWLKSGGTWRIIEIKEKGKREHFSS